MNMGTLSPNPWDLPLSRQNGSFRLGRPVTAPPFRPLDRRSGRIPAWPYPPPRYVQYKTTASVTEAVKEKSLPEGEKVA